MPTSRIQSEIKQRKPFRSRHQEAVIALMRTADVVRRRITQVVAPFGITGQQFNVLHILSGAGKDGIPTLEIAERMIERTPGITRLLDRLEAKGMVRRERCPTDRRQVMCWISDSGRELLKKLDGPVSKADTESLGDIRAEDLERFIAMLDDVRGEVE
jgi:DNA-binding MarR family transcriptional regulator